MVVPSGHATEKQIRESLRKLAEGTTGGIVAPAAPPDQGESKADPASRETDPSHGPDTQP
jgi:hypothetical protein